MPNTYAKITVQSLVDKIESLKKQEERGLKIENQFGNEAGQSSLIRQISISLYADMIELVNEHFKLQDEQPVKRRGGRKPGTKNKPKEELVTAGQEGNEEVAAGSEEE